MDQRAPEYTIPHAEGAEADQPVAIKTVLRIAIAYLMLGVTWIAASDWVLEQLAAPFPDPAAIVTRIQTIKGWAFILLTAIFLFFIVRYYIRSLQRTQERLRRGLETIAEQYQLLFTRNPLALCVYEPESLRIVAANQAALLTYGCTSQEMLARTAADFFDPSQRAQAAELLRSAENRFLGVWRQVRKDGGTLLAELTGHPITFGGRSARLLLVADVTERTKTEQGLAEYRQQLEQRVEERTTDLSESNRQLRAEAQERHRIEQELRAAKQAAESANASKSIFLANTSHEIRTPLTSILGYADLLSEPGLSAAQREKYVGILQQNAHHLRKLVDDLLELSRAELGKVRVVFDQHSPLEIASQALDLMRPRAEQKSLSLELIRQGDIPTSLWTDSARLRQVLLNLLNNAVKFTERGGVSLTLTATDQTPRTIQFIVADTGIGMDPEQAARVFEPFYQVQQGVLRLGGSGLGLAISKQLTQQMGGTLTFITAPHQESSFTVELPLERPESPESPAPPLPADSLLHLEGHLLLADDNANIRWLVEEFLTQAGARVTTAREGAEAVRHVRQAMEMGRDFDLVLLDLNMPRMDGLEALRQLRAAGYAGPIVGLTADATMKAPAAWTAEGWTAIVGKPIDRAAFIPLLARLLAERHPATSL